MTDTNDTPEAATAPRPSYEAAEAIVQAPSAWPSIPKITEGHRGQLFDTQYKTPAVLLADGVWRPAHNLRTDNLQGTVLFEDESADPHRNSQEILTYVVPWDGVRGVRGRLAKDTGDAGTA